MQSFCHRDYEMIVRKPLFEPVLIQGFLSSQCDLWTMLEFIFITDEQELQADSLTRVSSARCLSGGVNTLYICLHLITELEIVTNQHLMHSSTLCVCVCPCARARTSFDKKTSKKIFRSFHAVVTDAPFCGCERVRFCFFRLAFFPLNVSDW